MTLDLRKRICPFQVSFMTHSIFYSIYEKSDGRLHQNRPPDGVRLPHPSPSSPSSSPCFSTSSCLTLHSMSCNAQVLLSTTESAMEQHCSTQASAFSPAI